MKVMVRPEIGTRILPFGVDNVNPKVQDVTMHRMRCMENFVHVKNIRSMRSLKLEYPQRFPTRREIKEICLGCEQFEELHYVVAGSQHDLGKIFCELALQNL